MLRTIISLLISIFLAWWICDIDPAKEYTWYSGIWQGLFFVPNLIRSWFGDALYKAESYTTAYNIFYWIFSILSVLGWIAKPFEQVATEDTKQTTGNASVQAVASDDVNDDIADPEAPEVVNLEEDEDATDAEPQDVSGDEVN